jgi:hypothetical protein
MKIANFLCYLPCLSSELVQFAVPRKPSRPQISPSRPREGPSCCGLHLTLSLGKRTAILPRAFSTTISALEVQAVRDRHLSYSFLCSVKIRSPPL